MALLALRDEVLGKLRLSNTLSMMLQEAARLAGVAKLTNPIKTTYRQVNSHAVLARKGHPNGACRFQSPAAARAIP